VYPRLAAVLAKPFVFHLPQASWDLQVEDWTRFHLAFYGLSRLPRVIEMSLGGVEYLASELMWRARLGVFRRMDRRALDEVRRATDEALRVPPAQVVSPAIHWVSTGLGPLEFERFGDRLKTHSRTPITFFGPVCPPIKTEIAGPLAEWLASASSQPVLFISFGTMLAPRQSHVDRLADGLRRVNAKALWVLASRVSRHLSFPESIRVEHYVPQREVLESPAIRCCITHAGAGVVQEAILAGKPNVCMPFEWDQFYNASIVESLGVGRKIAVSDLTAKAVADALDSILREPRYAKTTLDVRRALLEQNGTLEIISFFERIAPIKPPPAAPPTR
jgi:UDP:flavonoid glycosyltransferase YjiC (YdhE family)